MMQTREMRYDSSVKGERIYAKFWESEKPKLLLQIAHGMAEHIERYDDFARFMTARGITVFGNDHLGHGQTAGDDGIYGCFAERDGWTHAVEDLLLLRDIACKQYPNVPVVLLGHSMGSFLARTVASRKGEGYRAFVFSGTAGKNAVIPIARFLARREVKKSGATAPSLFLSGLAFGAYNKHIENPQTPFDWLSRDREIVSRYEADARCGFCFTAGGFLDLFDGLSEIQQKSWAKKVPDVPILFIAGDADPVGDYGKGIRQVVRRLEKAGKSKVQIKLYEGARHEVINETCRDEVYRDVVAFLENL